MVIVTLFAVGFLLASGGFVVFFAVLVSSGGASRSQQFRVLRELFAGQHGSGRRAALLASFVAMMVGGCTALTGVGMRDSARKKACETRCAAEGYNAGRIGPSKENATPNRAKYVACICEATGREPLELRADSLTDDPFR